MPEKNDGVETMNLQGVGANRDGEPIGRRRQDTNKNKRVIIIGALVTVCIIILIIVGAWFIYTTVNDSHPEWLHTVPGLHYRPNSSIRDSLIMFRSTDQFSYEPWVHVLDNFFKDYEGNASKSSSNSVVCDYNHFPPPGTVCHVDIRQFHHCNRENNFGYHRSAPCIFLKIHKFPNWVPEYYNTTDLPESMPQYLKNHISMQPPEKLQTLWVSCDGETPSDQEFIGPIQYYPQMGFPGYFFPYKNTEGYMSPLVAVSLERPRSGVVINIECKLWAKNIVHNQEKGTGLVRFEIMID